MTTTRLLENTVTVAGKPIFVAETGSGLAVIMLHGGGPGASGVSNYSRNIDALAQQFGRRRSLPALPFHAFGIARHFCRTGLRRADRGCTVSTSRFN